MTRPKWLQLLKDREAKKRQEEFFLWHARIIDAVRKQLGDPKESVTTKSHT